MFIDIGDIAKENWTSKSDDTNGSIATDAGPTPDMLQRLGRALEPLFKILDELDVQPSMPLSLARELDDDGIAVADGGHAGSDEGNAKPSAKAGGTVADLGHSDPTADQLVRMSCAAAIGQKY